MKNITINIIIYLITLITISSCAAIKVVSDPEASRNIKEINFFIQQKRWAEAQPAALSFVNISENKLGKYHDFTIKAKKMLAITYFYSGNLNDCEILLNDIVNNAKTALTDEDYSETLAILAAIKEKNNSYEESIRYYFESISVKEKIFGNDNYKLVSTLLELSGVLINSGNYADADKILTRVLNINKDNKNDINTISLYSNLAKLHCEINDNETSENYLKKSISALESSGDLTDELKLMVYMQTSNIYSKLKYKNNAHKYLDMAMPIAIKVSGGDGVEVGNIYNNKGALYIESDLKKAKSYLEKSLQIKLKLNKDKFDTAATINNLAIIELKNGNFEKAEDYYRKSLQIWMNKFDKNHYLVSIGLSNIGDVKARKNEYQNAIKYLVDSIEIDENINKNLIAFTTESQRLSILNSQEENFSKLISIINKEKEKNKSIVNYGLNSWLKRKGVIFESQKLIQFFYLNSNDENIKYLINELAKNKKELSLLILQKPNNSEEDYKSKIEHYDQIIKKIEKNLYSASDLFARKVDSGDVSVNKISNLLPKNAALIDFLKIKDYDYSKRYTEKNYESSPEHYFAFILQSGSSESKLIDLGDSKNIENSLKELRNSLDPDKYQQGDFQVSNTVNRLANKVYKLIFQPLEHEIDGYDRLYISPDAELNLLPFEILADNSSNYLIDKYTFYYLTVSRDLLNHGKAKSNLGKKIIFGNPDFDLIVNMKKGNLKFQNSNGHDDSVYANNILNNFSAYHFDKIEYTKEEVDVVSDILGKESCDIFEGANANEDRLNFSSPPSILHLATHGFYFDLKEFDIDTNLKKYNNKYYSESSLLRSGFALNGANLALKKGNIEINDGLVTSDKILALNLQGTEMVVLSTCNSGVGEIKNGEGVFGMRRSFYLAGAKSVVMSMWSVSDKHTTEIMKFFYKNLKTKKFDKSEALRYAELEEMKAIKAIYGHANPYFWGPFIFSGES